MAAKRSRSQTSQARPGQNRATTGSMPKGDLLKLRQYATGIQSIVQRHEGSTSGNK